MKTGEFGQGAAAGNASLQWRVGDIAATVHGQMTEVFRHLLVSRKTPSEASTRQW